MPEAISNTSPLVYLHRIASLEWLGRLFTSVWVPNAVVRELEEGKRRGWDVPDLGALSWFQTTDPSSTPSEWLALDLGAGERAAMALALEHPSRILLVDDALARRTARAAGIAIWGTLKILLEAKSHMLCD